ncbi:hypothetical protein MtrunA17_Chr5g0437211 [Medicago truncatula]|uniref:Uncharacterized protein n=1 Tax=Medicago truncatula TaxID=3880 RepID=A0A396HYY9_MEDTR|nr:hypothetical protein MtrunA17_Chr5g0437211 [Medicago truncatula]
MTFSIYFYKWRGSLIVQPHSLHPLSLSSQDFLLSNLDLYYATLPSV